MYYLYEGREYSSCPVYGEDGVSRYAIHVWQDEEPLNPLTESDLLWDWQPITVPSWRKSYGLLTGKTPVRAPDGWEDVCRLRPKDSIFLPVCGGFIDRYGGSLHIASWQAVMDGKEDDLLAVASVPWDRVRRDRPDLSDRCALYASARRVLETEIAVVEQYLNDPCYGYTVIDLLGYDCGISCGGFYDEDELRVQAEAECRLYEEEWEEEYYKEAFE